MRGGVAAWARVHMLQRWRWTPSECGSKTCPASANGCRRERKRWCVCSWSFSARDHPPPPTWPSTVDLANHAAATPTVVRSTWRSLGLAVALLGLAAAWLAGSTVDGRVESGGWSRADGGWSMRRGGRSADAAGRVCRGGPAMRSLRDSKTMFGRAGSMTRTPFACATACGRKSAWNTSGVKARLGSPAL